MKQQFHITAGGIQRIKKKTMRQFIPLLLLCGLFVFASWWFILRPELHFGNPKRWIPGIVCVTGTSLLFLFYAYKAYRSSRRLEKCR